MHSTGTQADAKKHSREGQKQTTGIIFKCLPGQVVLKNQWLRITEKKMANVKQELSQLGMTEEKGSDDRGRPITQDLKDGETEGGTRVTYRQGQY